MKYVNPNRVLLFKTYGKAIKILLNSNVSSICPTFGMLLNNSIITEEEYEYVVSHFHMNKPTRDRFREIFYHPLFIDSVFWWKVPYAHIMTGARGGELVGQRVKFLKLLRRSIFPNPIDFVVYYSLQLIKLVNIPVKNKID